MRVCYRSLFLQQIKSRFFSDDNPCFTCKFLYNVDRSFSNILCVLYRIWKCIAMYCLKGEFIITIV